MIIFLFYAYIIDAIQEESLPTQKNKVYEKILIPTDFSENGGDALAYKLSLVGNHRSDISFLHVIDPDISTLDTLNQLALFHLFFALFRSDFRMNITS